MKIREFCYSIFDLFANCSAHIAKPTCEQSFEVHSLQNGIPSTMLTVTTFRIILSCNTTLLPSSNSFIMIGVSRDLLSSALSHNPNLLTPSSRLLLTMPNEEFPLPGVLLFLSDNLQISPLSRNTPIVCQRWREIILTSGYIITM
jgi:hypothetical protein